MSILNIMKIKPDRLFLILLLILVCVTWFIMRNIKSQHLALRQNLIDIYTQRAQYLFVQMPDIYFDSFLKRFEPLSAALPEEIYKEFANRPSGICTGMLIYDANGNLCYPRISAVDMLSDAGNDANQMSFQITARAACLYPTLAALENWPDKTIRKLSGGLDLYGLKFKLADRTILATSSGQKMFSLTRASVKDIQDGKIAVQVFDNFGKCIEGDPNLKDKPFVTLSGGRYMPDFRVAVHFRDTSGQN